MKRLLLITVSFYCTLLSAQPVPFVLKGALKENRQQLYRSLINNSINKNLSLTLGDSTEDQWQQAFHLSELLNYRQAWVDSKVHSAFVGIEKRSVLFQRALMELLYANYPAGFLSETKQLLLQTNDLKVFAMCAVYILADGKQEGKFFLQEPLKNKLLLYKDDAILQQLQFQLNDTGNFLPPKLQSLFQKDFLPGNVLLLSLQRRNRNFPGMVLVRDAAGNFIRDTSGKIFTVPQLARSIANLHGYLTNGNTPEGIFRMDGFDTSLSQFIGPTTNIQLSMPFEKEPLHFYRDSTLSSSNWDIEHYKNLLPAELKTYYPLYQSYYAGKAGRTEIIAHGTTVDPAWFKSKIFYPLTPTEGCLTSKEIWNEENGRLMESDQQLLVDAINKAGGPYGYAIVINIDDQQKPVSPDDLAHLLSELNPD